MTAAKQASTSVVEEFLQRQGEQGKDIALLKSGLDNLASRLEEFIAASTKTIAALADAQSKNSGANWRFLGATFLGAGLFIAVAFGGMMTFVDLRSQVTMGPVVTSTELSKRDRDDLHKDVDALKTKTAAADTAIAVLNAHNAEVEAQVNCLDAVRNVTLAYQQQMNAILAQAGPKQIDVIPVDAKPQCRVSH